MLPQEEQLPRERYAMGERMKALLLLVEKDSRNAGMYLSRSHPKFLKKLFELEVPEIASGTVEIKAMAREAGSRAKIAVASNDPAIDPVGSMVGQRGVRVSTVINEIGGEKIDIIEWADDTERFIANALSPAKVVEVQMNPERHEARVIVPEDQLSLAIGKGGQNVRLAAKLTGWKIDVRSNAALEQPAVGEEGEVSRQSDPSKELTEQEGTQTLESNSGIASGEAAAPSQGVAPETPKKREKKSSKKVKGSEALPAE